MKYAVEFTGRVLGAIGAFEPFKVTVEAKNLDDARAKLYETHQDVHRPVWTPIFESAQPTAGPWHTPGERVESSIAHETPYIAIGNGSVHIGRAMITPNVSEDEARANAHRMAAAPDLLDALKGICEHEHACTCGNDNGACDGDCWNAIARAAIAKAEGRQ
jgi:hypothetical protein